jgi:hypothetical protein
MKHALWFFSAFVSILPLTAAPGPDPAANPDEILLKD